MRYIKAYKIFENYDISLTDNYEIGDYVCVDPNYFVDYLERLGKIIKKEVTGFNHGKLIYNFEVLFANGENMLINKPSMIIRKIITSEIEKFEAELTANKYNL